MHIHYFPYACIPEMFHCIVLFHNMHVGIGIVQYILFFPHMHVNVWSEFMFEGVLIVLCV